MTTRSDWEARVRENLGGKDIAALDAHWVEGIAAPALSAEAPTSLLPGEWPYTRGGSFAGRARARNMTRAEFHNVDQFRADVLDDVRGGAEALWIPSIAGGRKAAGEIVSVLREADVTGLLVALDASDDVGAAQDLAAQIAGSTRPESVVLFVDPFRGSLPTSEPLMVSTHAWRAAGAHGVLELAYAIATGVHVLRRLERDRVDVAGASRRLGFSVTVGRVLFVEIAKLRALRWLWAKVLASAGVSAPPAAIHAVSSSREMARRGLSNNILRGATHAFAAICGGADLVTVLPFDATRSQPGAEARRTARNTVSILRAECALGDVTDPGGGAGAVEQLTEALARAAWERFREIEARGGMAACLLSGEIRRDLERAAASRGIEPLIGETEFPDPEDEDAALPAPTGRAR